MSILHNIMFGASGGTAFSATGGTVTTVGAYTVHTFTTSGDFVVTGAKELDIFLVGKGGSGVGSGAVAGGGGGGGEVLQTTYTFSTNTYGIRVGGAGTLYGTSEDYSALQLAVDNILIQADRGSDGTNGSTATTRNGGASGNGYAGGLGSNTCGSAGGGGGASQVGYNGGNDANASRGGDGLSNDWLGSTTYYGGGGGGGKGSCTQTNFGGQGGGGNGATAGTFPKNAATVGAANTGGGGGGGAVPDVGNGRAGGTGIVIIRYLT